MCPRLNLLETRVREMSLRIGGRGVVHRSGIAFKKLSEFGPFGKNSSEGFDPPEVSLAATLRDQAAAWGQPVVKVSKETRVIEHPVKRCIAEYELKVFSWARAHQIATHQAKTAMESAQRS